MTADPASAFPALHEVGQYVLEKKLGHGGMAEVWKARHKVLGAYVAIKFLSPGFAGVPDIERRFLGEGQRQAQLTHPNIVSAVDFLYENGRSYLIMRLIEGEDLDDRLFNLKGPMPLAEALSISGDVLKALDYAHSQHVIHRDIKPSNILLDREGRAYIMDFGIALVMGERRGTRVGSTIGTPQYMSPEQILGARDLDHRADIYSYGCVLYFMLTGKLPYDVAEGDSGTDYAIQSMHLHETAALPRQINPAIPEHVERAVMRCLEKKPENRFNSCLELLSALTAADKGSSSASPKTPAPVTPPSGVRRPIVLPTPAPTPAVLQPYQTPGPQPVPYQEPTQAQKGSRMMLMVSGIALAAIFIVAGVYWYTHRPPDSNDHSTTDSGKGSTASSPERPVQTSGEHHNPQSGPQQQPARSHDDAGAIRGGSDHQASTLPPPQVPAQKSSEPQAGHADKPPTGNGDQPKEASEAPLPRVVENLSGNWTGKYSIDDGNYVRAIRLFLSEQDNNILQGSLRFDPDGSFASSCSVKGVHTPQKSSLYLEITNCRGNSPVNLQNKFLLLIEPGDRAARGIDSKRTGMIEISRP